MPQRICRWSVTVIGFTDQDGDGIQLSCVQAPSSLQSVIDAWIIVEDAPRSEVTK